MMSRPHPRSSRAGFSLIELLIVITVIAILAALIAAAVIRAQVVGERTQAVAEINQLASACTAFKTAYGFYPPDSITIPSDAGSFDASPLKKMFPRWVWTGGVIQDGGTTLVGNRALVYFLGGPRDAGGPPGRGWAIDKPSAPSGTSKKGPFFDFPGNRLNDPSTSQFPDPGANLPEFADPWGTPYAYFRSTPSGYTGGAQPYSNAKEGTSAGSVSFYSLSGKQVNLEGVQVISAGPDAVFGPGGAWQSGSGAYSGSGNGADDLANFNGGAQLGTSN